MTGYVAQAQTVQLQINPTEGQTYTMENQAISKMTQSAMGQEATTNSTSNIRVHFTVNAVGETTFEMTAHYVNISMASEGQGQKISYSVDGKDEVSMGLKEMIGKPFQLSVDKRNGKVIKIEGEEAAFAEVENSLAALSKGKRKTAMDALKAGFGQEPIKSCAEACFSHYPANALRVGQAWMNRDTSTHESMGGQAFSDIQYKLVGFDAEKAEITAMGMMQTDPANPPVEQSGMEMAIQMGGSVSGKMTVDIANGWVLEGEITFALSGSIDVSVQGQTINVPVKGTLQSLVKRIE